MPITQTERTRVRQLGDGATPDGLALLLFIQGVIAIRNSDTDGLLQRYLSTQGIPTLRQIVRGLKFISQDDDDFTYLLRPVAILIYRFNRGAYPRLEEPSVEQTPNVG